MKMLKVYLMIVLALLAACSQQAEPRPAGAHDR
jgi:hypothetical protein